MVLCGGGGLRRQREELKEVKFVSVIVGGIMKTPITLLVYKNVHTNFLGATWANMGLYDPSIMKNT